MGDKTNISWCDKTWNPWQGCRKVSSGCLNCYMYREKARFKQDPKKVIRSKPITFNRPRSWKDPAIVFVCSWSDFFIKDADPWRKDAWDIIKSCPHLTFLLLTKRVDNITSRLPFGGLPPNVWLGATVENQDAVSRIDTLIKIPAAGHFVSVEPMVGPVVFEHHHFKGGCIEHCESIMQIPCVDKKECIDRDSGLDWVICGGESGPRARHMNPFWAKKLKVFCNLFGIPFFMKQMTTGAPIPFYLKGQEFPSQLANKGE